MSWIRRLALPISMVALGLGAAPAYATLRVTSASTGLKVEDREGNIGDRVVISAATLGGAPVFVVTNNNAFDIFKFERGAGCNPGSTDNKVVCSYGSGKVTMDTKNGDDEVDLSSSGASSSDVDLGDGDNMFQGSSGPDSVEAENGQDRVFGRGGADVISTHGGKDHVEGGNSGDHIEASESFRLTSDTVDGGAGNDFIRTGAGPAGDAVNGGTGADDIATNAGDDRIFVKDGIKDTVRCGLGRDEVTADSQDDIDAVSNPGGGTCDDVESSPLGETPHVIISGRALRVSPTGDVAVRLRCPRGTGKLGCKGSLQLRVARERKGGVQTSRSRKVHYKIRAGKRKSVTLRLSTKDVGTLRGRQSRGKRTRGILVSVEKGRKAQIGVKTTVRNPRLRVRGQ